jgi:hypothetical protein
MVAANPDNGSILTQRWCTGCLVVSGVQVKGPTLLRHSSRYRKDQISALGKIASFLLEPHPKMPNMAVTPEEAKDMSAFIAEQRRK